MIKLSLKTKLLSYSIFLSFITAFIITTSSIGIYLNQNDKNVKKNIAVMDSALNDKVNKSVKIAEQLFSAKMKQLELLNNMVANNSEVKDLIFNEKMVDDSAAYFRLAGKLEKTLFYDDMTIDLELVNNKGEVKGKTSRNFESFYESDYSDKIKSILEDAAVSLIDVVNTDDGLALKSYHAVMQVGRNDLSSQNQGVVILIESIGESSAKEMKETLGLDVILYGTDKYLTGSIPDYTGDNTKESREIFSYLLKNPDSFCIKDKIINNEKYRVGYTKIRDAVNVNIGMIGVVLPLKELDESVTRYKIEAEKTKNDMVTKLSLIGLLVMAFGTVLTYFIAVGIVNNIRKIERVVKEVAKGDFKQVIKVTTGDEIENLSDNINVMTAKLEESFEKEKKWSHELEHKIAERTAEIVSKNEELKKLDKLKDEFLANTSHELRTPLNGIIGIAESLVDGIGGELSPKAIKNLDIIISCGRRLSSLINDIMDFSKLKNNEKQFELNIKDVNLKNIADSVLELYYHLSLSKKIELINEIPDYIIGAVDKNRFQQILNNLIGNAIKFTEKGYIKIYASQKDEFYAISIEDTGIGIPADKLESIFIPFEQGDGSTAREYGGTGLGLSIAKKLVELGGGTISVASVQGNGSVFTFTVPVSHAIKDTDEEESRIELIKEESSDLLSFSLDDNIFKNDIIDETKEKVNILIIDDEPVNLMVLENILVFQGYNVTKTTEGKKALEMIFLETIKFDLVISDVMMPIMSGFDVCKGIRSKYTLFELPILLLTANTQVENLRNGFNCGTNDYLTKPINKDELLARVNTLVMLKQSLKEVKTIDKMKERLEILERIKSQVIQQQRLVIMGITSANTIHDIKNLILSVKLAAQNIRFDLEDIEESEAKKSIQDSNSLLINSIEMITEVVHNSLSFASQNTDKYSLDLAEVLNTVKKMMENQFEKSRITLNIEVERNIIIFAKKTDIISLFNNLLSNAYDAIIEYEKIEKREYNVGIKGVRDSDYITIIVTDNGPGMPDEVKERIFEPFFTTKEIGKGTGLGMFAIMEILREYDSTIDIQSTVGLGTTIIIKIPNSSVEMQMSRY